MLEAKPERVERVGVQLSPQFHVILLATHAKKATNSTLTDWAELCIEH